MRYASITLLLATVSLSAAIDVLMPTVETPNMEYVRLLNHSILFYEAQRAGKLPENNRVPWRHDSTLNDGMDDNIDLSGGYYDAGNYLKFTLPLSYSIFMLCWGGSDYIRGYELANQTYYFRQQIKWGTDWLIKAHPEPTTLYVQVGDVQVDNGYFGPDINIPEPRPTYKITEKRFGTDVAAMTSAAFSSAFIYFRALWEISHNEEDFIYAETLLNHSKQLHAAAISILPYKRYQKSIDAKGHSYSSSGYMDDLILSGISLYKATKDIGILNQALVMYREHDSFSRHADPLDWDDKWGAVYVLLAEVLMDFEDKDAANKARIEAETYLDGIVSGETANKTNGGLLFWNEYSKANSNSVAMSASHLLLSYAMKVLRPLSKTVNETDVFLRKADQYEELAKSQLDYIFGKNPMDQNYVVGARLNSPKYPHSAPASGFKDLNEALATPSNLLNSHVIYGALVGGPSNNDSFTDKRLDWSQTEVALDYNAPYQNVLAYQVMFSKEDPFYMSLNGSKIELPCGDGEHQSLGSWQFALAVGMPIMFVLTICVILFVVHKHRQRESVLEQEAVIDSIKKRRLSRDRRPTL